MRKTLAAILFLSPLFSLAQNRINEYYNIGWYALFVTPKISNKVSAHIEYQWRRVDWIKNWQQSFWGSNYKRLAAVKKRYDPEGLFFVHHGVGSEDWSDDGFTKIH